MTFAGLACSGVKVDPQGRIVVAGQGMTGPTFISRLLPNGAIDTSFTGSDAPVTLPGLPAAVAMTLDSGSTIVLAGTDVVTVAEAYVIRIWQ